LPLLWAINTAKNGKPPTRVKIDPSPYTVSMAINFFKALLSDFFLKYEVSWHNIDDNTIIPMKDRYLARSSSPVYFLGLNASRRFLPRTQVKNCHTTSFRGKPLLIATALEKLPSIIYHIMDEH